MSCIRSLKTASFPSFAKCKPSDRRDCHSGTAWSSVQRSSTGRCLARATFLAELAYLPDISRLLSGPSPPAGGSHCKCYIFQHHRPTVCERWSLIEYSVAVLVNCTMLYAIWKEIKLEAVQCMTIEHTYSTDKLISSHLLCNLYTSAFVHRGWRYYNHLGSKALKSANEGIQIILVFCDGHVLPCTADVGILIVADAHWEYLHANLGYEWYQVSLCLWAE